MPTSSAEIRRRVNRCDWGAATRALDERGHARLPNLLTAPECATLRKLWERPERFRSSVDMKRHGFGEGEYRYFSNPVPPLVRALRTHLYPPLARIANVWDERLALRNPYPLRWSRFRERCLEHAQTRPTPLLLQYEVGGYNCLHQDLYGAIAFPLQVVFLLSAPEEFEGGEVLLVEQRPRMQSRGEAITLRRGEALVFPNRVRPMRGTRGDYRVAVRHGVSRVLRGRRTALGIIFHEAR
jgi:hypothetical protein